MAANGLNRFGVFYKLRHIPSGLYYAPLNFNTNSNLNEFGALYPAIPLDLREGKHAFFYDEYKVKRILYLGDWEIVQVELKEIGVLNYEHELKRKHDSNRGRFYSTGQ